MSLFSFKWFRSTKEKELEQEVKKLNLELSEFQSQVSQKPAGIPQWSRAYKNIYIVNNSVTVVLHNGTTLIKTGSAKETYTHLQTLQTEIDIIEYMATDEVKREIRETKEEVKNMEEMKERVHILENNKDFELKDGAVYLKGIERSLPKLLIERFSKVVSGNSNFGTDREFLALKRFFMWCCLNPDASVADDLYDFLSKGQFRITKHGGFLGYRNVVAVNNSKNKELVSFISNVYTNVKIVWKKNPSNYSIYKAPDGEYIFSKKEGVVGELLGNLKSLYLGLPDMQEMTFTDAHTNTMDIRIGKAVKVSRSECNHNKASCSSGGLHMSNDQFNYSPFGDQGILVMAFPHNVVAIPDNGSKLRVCEYFPIMTLDDNEMKKILGEPDFDTLEIDDGYVLEQLEDLEKKTKENFAMEAKKHTYKIPELAAKEVKTLVESLEEIKKELNKRVTQV